MDTDHTPVEPERSDGDEATPFVPPGISARRPTDLERFSIRGRRL